MPMFHGDVICLLNALEAAESEVARLNKERDWLADMLHRTDPDRFDTEYWKRNARRAVDAREVGNGK